MLVALCLVTGCWLLTMCVIAKIAETVLRRLRIDPMTALLWLGLAEEPKHARSAGRRLGEYVTGSAALR